jgi:Mrp family chromosome partitioning ATPase
VALGLAMTVAEMQNWPVLLIDGNFADPRVGTTFKLPKSKGLGDLIAGKAEVGSLIQATAFPLLQVLAAGTPPMEYVSTMEPSFIKDLLRHCPWITG